MKSQEDKCAQVGVAPSRISIGNYVAVSESEIEHFPAYFLVKGESFTVLEQDGKVLYKDVRGFMPLSKTRHLVRVADGSWKFCAASDGHEERSGSLREVNVKFKHQAVMFDDRGKLRLGQCKPAYSTIYA